MILGRSQEHIAQARILALHGMSKDAWHRFSDQGYKHYEVVTCGFKYNMMDLQAAIGLHQLANVEKNLCRREVIWQYYEEAFADLPIGLPAPALSTMKHGRHLYTVMINQQRCGMARDAFLNAMNAARIGTGVHYLSISEHPYYQQRFGWQPECWPNAMRLGRETVSLPMSPGMSDDDVQRVIAVVRAILTSG